MGNLSAFIAAAAALSVSVERIVEILKQTLGGLPFVGLLFKPITSDLWKENVRCAVLQLLSGVIGATVAHESGIDFLKLISPDIKHTWQGDAAIAGLVASGGSAFWNHALDILKASKVVQEQAATKAIANNAADPVVTAKRPLIA